MKKYLSMILCAVILLASLTSCVVKDVKDGLEALIPENDHTLTLPTEEKAPEPDPIDTFSFALEWNVNGDSTYDSKTGTLVKQKIATNLDDFTTTLFLNDEQLAEAYGILSKLDYSKYPTNENYNPGKGMSAPADTLVLTVRIGGVTRTITARGIAFNAEGKDKAGQAFLDACYSLKEMIYATPEWQSLPEWEFLYD